MLKSERPQLQAVPPRTGSSFIRLGRSYPTSEPPSLLRPHPEPILLPKDLPTHCPSVSGYPGSKESPTCWKFSRWKPKVQFRGTTDGTALAQGWCHRRPGHAAPGDLPLSQGSLLIWGLPSKSGFQRHGNVSNSKWGAIEKSPNTKSLSTVFLEGQVRVLLSS